MVCQAWVHLEAGETNLQNSCHTVLFAGWKGEYSRHHMHNIKNKPEKNSEVFAVSADVLVNFDENVFIGNL